MKILITNIWLHSHGGTEVYVRDLAMVLHKRGVHVEVYSPLLGPVADEIRHAGIHITDTIDDLVNKPDLIHAQHFIPTLEVISRFPDVPVIYFLHDRTHLIDTPPKYSRILKYIAVDNNCLDRLIIDNGIEKEKTDVLYNWVDTSRFKLRSNFSDKPVKALVFSNYADRDNYFKTIQETCTKMGIELDGLGLGFGNSVSDPERILSSYDIVFAKAKAAMEALATGAAVILCDSAGLGEMVTLKNLEGFRKLNFGMKTLTRPVSAGLIIQEIEKYNPEEIKKAAKELRNKATFDLIPEKMLNLYQETIEKDSQNRGQINETDRRLILDYNHLKKVLFQDRIDNYQNALLIKEDALNDKDSLLKRNEGIINENELHIQNQKEMIQNLTDNYHDILNSGSFRLGRFLTFVPRIVKKFIKSFKQL